MTCFTDIKVKCWTIYLQPRVNMWSIFQFFPLQQPVCSSQFQDDGFLLNMHSKALATGHRYVLFKIKINQLKQQTLLKWVNLLGTIFCHYKFGE